MVRLIFLLVFFFGFVANAAFINVVGQGSPGASAWLVDGSAHTQPVSGTFWQATQPVSGTFWQTTQPVSQSGTWSVLMKDGSGNALSSTSGALNVSVQNSSLAVTGTFWQTTQPVSGSVTATISGTPNVNVTNASIPVTGTFWQATQPVSGTFWQATQPVSGTVTANAGTGTFATSSTQLPAALGQTTSANSLPVVIASDQSELTVNSTTPVTAVTPTSNSMAALNATVQYTLQPGGNYYLSLTNGPGVTSAWSGTVTFQYSLNNGSSYSSLTAIPIAGPSGAANVTTATANGLWYVSLPANNQNILVRANMTSYSSGTAYFFAQANLPASRVMLPWTYTVTSGQTLMGPIDATGFTCIDVQLSAVTTTVVTAQGTNDPTLTTWVSLPVISGGTQAAAASTLTAALTYRVNPEAYKWVRLQVTTTGTVLTVQGISGLIGQQPLLLTSIGNDMGVTVNSGTLTTVSTVTSVTTTGTNNTTYTNADIASAAIITTTTGSAVTVAAGTSVAWNVAITAASGTNPTYDFVVQESGDGTNYTTIYAAPRQTTTGFFITPSIKLNHNRYRIVETIGGSSPSFTRAVTSSRTQGSNVYQRNIVDRTIVPSSTSSTTASLYSEGASQYTMIVNQGTGGSAVQFAMDGSDDNSNWVQNLTNTFGVVGGATPVTATYSGAAYRYIRVRAVTGVASATISYVTIMASNNPGDTLKVQTGGFTDFSGTTSATPSTSTQAVAANAARKYLLIQNVSTTASVPYTIKGG